MTDKFTPGPWEVFNGDGCTNPGIEAEGQSIVVYGSRDDCGIHGKDLAEIEANATLIAAAPELLQALEGMAGIWLSTCSAMGWDPEHLPQYGEARAAIAKARGL